MSEREPIPVAVASRSFSRHPILRAELQAQYSDIRFNDEGVSLAGQELISFLSGRRRVITGLERIDEEILTALPELEVISKVGVGIDMLDLDALHRHRILLGWTQGTNSRSVAELVIALSLAVLRQITALDADVRSGGWRQRKGRLLSERSFGIIGFGAVGRDVAALLSGFGCSVLAHDLREQSDLPPNVKLGSLEQVLESSDIVSLHVPVSGDEKPLIDHAALARMGHGAILINTARGGLVDEEALAEALVSGRLAGAGLDVFTVEPPLENPILELENVVITPHIGGSTEEAILKMGRAAIQGLETARPVDEYLPRLA